MTNVITYVFHTYNLEFILLFLAAWGLWLIQREINYCKQWPPYWA